MLDDGSPSPPASKFSHSHPMEPMHEPFYIQSVRKKCENHIPNVLTTLHIQHKQRWQPHAVNINSEVAGRPFLALLLSHVGIIHLCLKPVKSAQPTPDTEVTTFFTSSRRSFECEFKVCSLHGTSTTSQEICGHKYT